MLQDLMHVAVRPVQRFNAIADPGVHARGRTEETVVQFGRWPGSDIGK